MQTSNKCGKIDLKNWKVSWMTKSLPPALLFLISPVLHTRIEIMCMVIKCSLDWISVQKCSIDTLTSHKRIGSHFRSGDFILSLFLSIHVRFEFHWDISKSSKLDTVLLVNGKCMMVYVYIHVPVVHFAIMFQSAARPIQTTTEEQLPGNSLEY